MCQGTAVVAESWGGGVWGQVEMYMEAVRDVQDILPGVHVAAGERILMEVSRKFTARGLHSLAFHSSFFIQVTLLSPRRNLFYFRTASLPPAVCTPWPCTSHSSYR
jgi:hypothetical protein